MIDQRNILLAIVLSVAILVGWQFIFVQPQADRQAQVQEQTQQAPQTPRPVTSEPAATQQEGVASTPTLGASVPSVLRETQSGILAREDALKKTARVQIVSSRLSGSISLVGARFDDLVLSDYRETIDRSSPNIVLLSPTDTSDPYYAEFGWLGANVKAPNGLTVWQADRSSLTPDSPVTLTWDNGEGLRFERRYALDDDYMLEVTQRVRNSGSAAVHDRTLRAHFPDQHARNPQFLYSARGLARCFRRHPKRSRLR